MNDWANETMRKPSSAAQSLEQFERLTLGIDFPRADSELHVRITANLNRQNAPLVKSRVVDAIAEGVRRIVIDLAYCPRIDREGLYVLAAIAGDARRAGGGLTITNATDEIRLLFENKGISKLFTIAGHPTDEPSEVAP
jgi:anti-anti-sigma factor